MVKRALSIALLGLGILVSSCNKEKGESGINENLSESSSVLDLRPTKNYAMLIIESKDCPYCKLLSHDLKDNKGLIEATKDMNIYKVIVENNSELIKGTLNGHKFEGSPQDLAESLGVQTFPNIFFLDKQGNLLLQIPGYLKPTVMTCVVNYINQGIYKKESIDEYAKSCPKA